MALLKRISAVHMDDVRKEKTKMSKEGIGLSQEKKGVLDKWKTRMINFAVLGLGPLPTVLHREIRNIFAGAWAKTTLFLVRSFWWRLKRGLTCSGRWDIWKKKKKKNKEKPEASTTFSVFMGLGIYEAVWMFSGICWTPLLGCVPAGATRPAVKGIVKEIPAFGSWEAWFFDV